MQRPPKNVQNNPAINPVQLAETKYLFSTRINLKRTAIMGTRSKNKIVIAGLLVISLIVLTYCSSVSEWDKKNQELIEQYDLQVRQVAGVPNSTIASNLEPARVKSLDSLGR